MLPHTVQQEYTFDCMAIINHYFEYFKRYFCLFLYILNIFLCRRLDFLYLMYYNGTHKEQETDAGR